jgi:hypothetical protein
MTIETKVLSDTLSAAVAAMFAAVKLEADTRDASVIALKAATATAWNACRDTFLPVLAKDKEEGLAVLEALKLQCKEAKDAGQETMQRGIQYASDLKRAYKAAKKGLALPPELVTASRGDWTAHVFWDEHKLKAASGRPAAAKPEGEAKTEGEGESVAELAKDAPLSSLMQVVGQLRGPFRAEFMREAETLAVSILAKQKAATGSGDAASHVEAKTEAKPEAPRKRKAA